MLLCVNGTLMRGLELNRNLLAVGAVFEAETETAPVYRLWSIRDAYPAMLRDEAHGAAVAVELWRIEPEGLVRILEQEPPGLAIGRIRLADGTDVLGVLAEPYIVAGQREITALGGWRAHLATLAERPRQP